MSSPRRQPLRAAPRFTPLGERVGGPAPDPADGSTTAARIWDDPEDVTDLVAHPAAPAPDAEPPTPTPRRRSALLGLGIGLAVTVAAVAIAFSIVAIPLFALASIDPGSGLDRDLVRKGLFFVALPFGGLAGLLSGVSVGIWYGRGGRLPKPDLRLHER